jgi:hypothetical protein
MGPDWIRVQRAKKPQGAQKPQIIQHHKTSKINIICNTYHISFLTFSELFKRKKLEPGWVRLRRARKPQDPEAAKSLRCLCSELTAGNRPSPKITSALAGLSAIASSPTQQKN